MKKMTIRMTAIVLVLLAGVTIAQPDDIPKSCPSLPKQKAVPKKDLPRSPEQSEADRLVAEAQAAMRSPSCENVAKAISLKDYRGQNVLLIFYLGGSCTHCIAQLKDVIKRNKELGELGTTVLAVSADTAAELTQTAKMAEIPFPLLSDPKFENARRFKAYDDFEEMVLHSTILIDKRGRVHWSRTGGSPFTEFDFLLKEIKRLNESTNLAITK